MTRPELLDEEVVRIWLDDHPLWRVEHSHLVREILTVDYPTSARLILAQVQLAESLDHHPDVTLGYRRVPFTSEAADRPAPLKQIAMPKQKTHKGTKKRFRVTANGKVIRLRPS